MTNFIAYHNVDRAGGIYQPKKRNVFDSRKLKMLEHAVGRNVWVVQAEKQGGGKNRAMVYMLMCRFVPDHPPKALGDGWFRIEGDTQQTYNPPRVLNGLDWFERLFAQQNNFSFGFNTINDPDIVAAMKRIR